MHKPGVPPSTFMESYDPIGIQSPAHRRVDPRDRRSIDEAGVAAVYTVALAVPGRQIDKAITRPERQIPLDRRPIAQMQNHAGDPIGSGRVARLARQGKPHRVAPRRDAACEGWRVIKLGQVARISRDDASGWQHKIAGW